MPGPEIIWRDGSSLPEGDSGAARALMQPCRNGAAFCHKFDSIRRPLVFRASAAGVLTRAVRVRVRAVPALRGALFRVEPPAYAGEPAATNPGPPAGLSCLAGSRVELRFRSEPPARSATWLLPDGPAQCANEQGEWRAEWTAVRGGAYSVLLAEAESGGVVTCAAARVALIADAPREVEVGAAFYKNLPWASGGATLAAEIVRPNDDDARLALGAEYGWREMLYGRVGYRSGLNNEDMSFGFGINYMQLRFDYAFVPYVEGLGDSHRFSFNYCF